MATTATPPRYHVIRVKDKESFEFPPEQTARVIDQIRAAPTPVWLCIRSCWWDSTAITFVEALVRAGVWSRIAVLDLYGARVGEDFLCVLPPFLHDATLEYINIATTPCAHITHMDELADAITKYSEEATVTARHKGDEARRNEGEDDKLRWVRHYRETTTCQTNQDHLIHKVIWLPPRHAPFRHENEHTAFYALWDELGITKE